MLDIDRINDLDQLKQVTRLLQRENDRLHERLVELTRELAKLRGEQAQTRLALEITKLRKQMGAFQQQLQKAVERAGSLGSQQAADGAEAGGEPIPQRGHGPRAQPKLVTTDRVYELADDDRNCPACGGTVEDMVGQFEESEEVTVVQRQFLLVRNRRQKGRCRCNGAVVTASMPPRLIPGGRYSLEFAVEVAAAKYVDHLPLDRQRRIMQREGLTIDTQTLWDQIFALSRVLAPSYDALLARILDCPQVGADETWWRLIESTSSQKWWDWCLTTCDTVYHRIHRERSAAVVQELLHGYTGTVMSDAFAAYGTLQRAGPLRCRHAHCWAHVRRKFDELEPLHPAACGEVLALIATLYAIERTVPQSAEALPMRLEIRQQQSRPVVNAIREWAYAQRASPQSALRGAIDYMFGVWAGLVRFLDDPAVPLDNNATERSIKPVVLGRKNHYGSKSQRGTEVAALFYSLVETAKLCGIDPKDYLLQAAHAALQRPGSVLLPHDLAAPSAAAA